MACVDRIAKNGRNTTQNYDYTKAEDVYDAVRAELVKRFIRPKARHEETTFVPRASKSGGEMVICTIKGHLDFIDAETGEVESYPSIGQGSDSLDKAAAKAVTAFMKQGIITAFLIPTGTDPEQEPKGRPSPPPPPQGLAAVKRQMGAPNIASAAQRAANGAPATHDRTLQYPFGNCKGVPIGDPRVDEKSLAFWAERCEEELRDASKAKWHDKARSRLATIRAEQQYRADAHRDVNEADDRNEEPPPIGDEYAP